HRISLRKLSDVLDLQGLSVCPEQRARISVSAEVVKLVHKGRSHANTTPATGHTKHGVSNISHRASDRGMNEVDHSAIRLSIEAVIGNGKDHFRAGVVVGDKILEVSGGKRITRIDHFVERRYGLRVFLRSDVDIGIEV